MANEKKIDCVILGLLTHEELTGYEIKKRMDITLKYFWSASYGSVYPALSDLVNRGLATKREDTENKRNKLIYTITDEGRSYLKEWLKLPIEKIQNLQKLSDNLSADDFQELMYIYELRERLVVCRSVIAHLKARHETRWHSFAENLDYPNKDDKNFLKYVNSRLENGEIKIILRDLVKEDAVYEHSN